MSQIQALKVFRHPVVRRIRLLVRISLREAFSHLDVRAIVIVALALAAAALAYLAIPDDDAAVRARFSPEIVEFYHVLDSAPQKYAFLLFLLLIIFGGFLSPLLKGPLDRDGSSPKSPRPANGWLDFCWSKFYLIVGALLCLVVLTSIVGRFWALIGAAILVIAVAIGRFSWATWIIWAATSALVVLAIVPGWIGTPIPDPKFLFSHDAHYAAVLSHGERLAAGHLLFHNNSPSYGLLVPIAIGIIAQIESAISFAGLLRITQASQTLCLVALLIAAWLRTCESPGFGRVLALLIVALATVPFVNTVGMAIWAPNQSGVRFLMLAVAVIVACTLKPKASYGSSAIAGLAVGIALLFNIETGIAIAAGLGLAWLVSVRREPLAAAAGTAVLGLASVLAVFALVAFIYRATFGVWPLPARMGDAFAHMGLFLTGGGGLHLKLRTPAILILVHSAYLVTRALRYLVSAQSDTPNISDTAIAGILLAWFFYWINRPDDWNLWTYLVLYALLLAPTVAARGRSLVGVTVAAFLILSVPMKFAKSHLLTPLTKEQLILGWHTGCGDGLILPPVLCSRLEERATALRQWAAEGDVIWVTSLPMLTMRMTGLHGPLSTIDVFNGSPTPSSFNQLVDKIEDLRPYAIILDFPLGDDLHHARFQLNIGTPWTLPAFIDRLLAALGADRCPSRFVGGWRLVEITATCKSLARQTNPP